MRGEVNVAVNAWQHLRILVVKKIRYIVRLRGGEAARSHHEVVQRRRLRVVLRGVGRLGRHGLAPRGGQDRASEGDRVRGSRRPVCVRSGGRRRVRKLPGLHEAPPVAVAFGQGDSRWQLRRRKHGLTVVRRLDRRRVGRLLARTKPQQLELELLLRQRQRLTSDRIRGAARHERRL
jgi:hypothetical protein